MIRPGQTIGIVGGGQLGRMFALAARRMGYRVHVLDPTPDCPAGQAADSQTTAAYDNLTAARDFAAGVDVVTFEFENVPSRTLAVIEQERPVRPSPFVLDMTRHRLREKTFLSENGFPVAPFRRVTDVYDLAAAIKDLGTPCVLKTAEFGYDGKGQSKIDSPDQAEAAWKALICPLGVLEGFVRFQKEISVIVARNDAGEARAFDPFENVHTHHILDTTICPARIAPELSERATELAKKIAEKIGLVGLLCVELFVVGDDLVVNELAPRPHNSGHLTGDACVTSQFEQHLRAVCGLPLGDTSLMRPAAMANLLGDLWANGDPKWENALADPTVKLHLYGKRSARPGRKMGHLNATGATADEACEAVRRARDALL
ncbi:MAG: phosphoribosylaminoimidazole carboxylase [Phycisphaerales bacterium]|nr:phosphoribosylaminoimidazole carboxylase [Phycisphaerales bacterium]